MFIVFEGPDGAGKSTQVELLANSLIAGGMDVLSVREPGGTEVGEAARNIMFAEPPLPMLPLTWAFLMNAARSELVGEVIRPALARGTTVLADRYWYSTLAYQGEGEGLDSEMVHILSRLATGGLEPDLVICLAVPPAVGMSRKHAGNPNVLDRRPLEFHMRVVEAYETMARREPAKWRVLRRYYVS